MGRTGKLNLFYEFLIKMEESKQKFTSSDADNATEYTSGTSQKYLNQYLNGLHVEKVSSSHWLSVSVSSLSKDEFFRLVSQSTNAKKLTFDEKQINRLMDRSLDAFILSLEVYNRPTLRNRVEAFAIMMVNAWELFLKAEIINRGGYSAIFMSDGKSIPISKAVEKLFNSKDAVADSINELISLRDQAVHLLIPEMQPLLSRLFQSNVLNYQKRYINFVGKSPIAGQSSGMLSLIIAGDNVEITAIHENYGQQTAEEVEKFLKNFEQLEIEHDSDEFSVSVDYQLSLSRNPNKADLTLVAGGDGKNVTVLTKTKTRSIKDTYKYLTADVKDHINSRQNVPISSNDLYAVISKHRIKGKKLMHDYTDRHRYSEGFVEWFVDNLNQPNWLDSAREHYQKMRTQQIRK
jgi:hypothetical protein